jgi:GAF domain-containing protein
VSAPPPGLRDPDRLAALHRTALLDSPPEAAFDRLTALATRVTGAPIALVTLIDERRQFFKSCVGLPEPWNSDRESGLEFSICQHVVGSASALIVPDAREHPLLRENRVIAEANVVAYAGIPLVTSDGFCLGTFCLMDRRPRAWSENEVAILADLAALAVARIELQVTMRERERACAAAEATATELDGILSAIGEVVLILDRDGRYLAIGPSAHERLARPAGRSSAARWTKSSTPRGPGSSCS